MTTPVDPTIRVASNEPDPPVGLGRRLRSAIVSVPGFFLGALLLVSLLAPLIATHDPLTPNPLAKLLPPSSEHIFGTDPFGFDVFSRTIYAGRLDLTVALGSVLLGAAIGVPVGVAAGYLGGTVDSVLMRLTEVIQAFPPILFAMLVFAGAGNNVATLIGIIAFFNVPVYVRMVRAVIQPIRDASYVRAARAMGHGHMSLIWKHLLPNSLVPVFAQFAVSSGFAIQMVAGLSFLGLGVEFPRPEWGSMISAGANQIVFGQWWPSIFPGIAVFLAALTLNALGQRLRKAVLVGGPR